MCQSQYDGWCEGKWRRSICDTKYHLVMSMTVDTKAKTTLWLKYFSQWYIDIVKDSVLLMIQTKCICISNLTRIINIWFLYPLGKIWISRWFMDGWIREKSVDGSLDRWNDGWWRKGLFLHFLAGKGLIGQPSIFPMRQMSHVVHNKIRRITLMSPDKSQILFQPDPNIDQKLVCH